MKEIKFRAYLKNENKIVDVHRIDFVKKEITHYENIELPFPTVFRYAFKDIELMQFTGLVDKNGKEIYEGDIVHFKNSYYVVKYFSEYGRFAMSDNIVQDSLPMVIGNPLFFEAIGNIYENKF